MDVRIIGVPMDLGADRRGVDMGPSALRYAEVSDTLEELGIGVEDNGDLSVPQPESRSPDTKQPQNGTAKYLREVRNVCQRVEKAVDEAIEEGAIPLVLGGDHSIAIGTANGASSGRDIGVLWFDAHGDCNTPETTPTGNVHGMSLAALLGLGAFSETEWARSEIKEENVALVGLRDLDDGERAAIEASEIDTYTTRDIDRQGIVSVVKSALESALDGVDRLHVSLDMDVLDPGEAPGVGTPVHGGVSYREAHAAMELVADTGACRSMELVEVNPILDSHNRTAELAVELTASTLGKRIL